VRDDGRFDAGCPERLRDKPVEVEGDDHLHGTGRDEPGDSVVGGGRLLLSDLTLLSGDLEVLLQQPLA
jgi:hypothetical protein